MTSSSWLAPGNHPPLASDEVHVWRFSLDPGRAALVGYHDTLTYEESTRAARFRFPEGRRRFTAARGALRALLARYLSCRPDAVSLRYGDHGKPSLEDETAPLRFNLSHSGELGLIAVTRGRELGVDIEHVRENLEAQALADRFFTRREAALLAAGPELQRQETFFRLWTCKEACLKACGRGLSLPLNQVEIALAPDQPAALSASASAGLGGGDWELHELRPDGGYVGAVVAEGIGWTLRCWTWVT